MIPTYANVATWLLAVAGVYAAFVVLLCLWFRGATTLPTPKPNPIIVRDEEAA